MNKPYANFKHAKMILDDSFEFAQDPLRRTVGKIGRAAM
jgi:hypothetical protein